MAGLYGKNNSIFRVSSSGSLKVMWLFRRDVRVVRKYDRRKCAATDDPVYEYTLFGGAS